ncbi:RNA polymerase sigma factor SigF [Pseudonocardia acaciae]|uniref:RNA polymerase sigma factor SigF n=1 Tax=Pseudonocardia acaciae TaxID=551276 RepID=UPI000A061488|nr:RNA polymerase sigma factor SigF [Pseudonocardia acaciae]
MTLSRGGRAGGQPPVAPLETSTPGGGGSFGQLAETLAEFAATTPGDPRRAALRDRLVTGYLPVAQRMARRFARRGEPVEDLTQVATVGLIRALDRYDPELTDEFLSYLVPTITGEIRRYFRDQGWSMRVPRRLKDLHVAITTATSQLFQDLGRAPRPSEIAERLDLPVEEVLEGLEAGQAYRASSLDEVLTADNQSGETTLGELLGEPDPDLEHVEYHEALQPMLAELPERERAILTMRFYANMTQSQIAERIGVSQMHVSRLLTATLARLRERFLDDQPPDSEPV